MRYDSLLGIICLLACSLTSAFAEELDNAPATALLQEAFRKSRQASYIAEIHNLKWVEFPEITRGVFYRQVQEDGKILRRAELYAKGRLKWIFLENREGKYAVHCSSGIVAQGGDFLRLYCLEPLTNQPYWGAVEKCSFQSKTTKINSRECQILTVTTPGMDRTGETEEDRVFFMNVTENWNGKATCADIKNEYPFVREYRIDRQEGVIVGLRRFNWHGKLLSSLSVDKLQVHPDWEKCPGIFDAPERVDCTVATTKQFAKLVKKLQRDQRATQEQHGRRGRLPGENRWLPAVVKYLLLAAGCLLVGGAWWLRRQGRE